MSWLLMRFLKWVALFVLFSGTVGAFRGSNLRDRQWAAYWLATPGFIGTWVVGYLMADERLISLGSPRISASMLLSLGSLAVTVWSVERERRGRSIAAVMGIGALVLSTGTMVWKSGGTRVKAADVHEVQP